MSICFIEQRRCQVARPARDRDGLQPRELTGEKRRRRENDGGTESASDKLSQPGSPSLTGCHPLSAQVPTSSSKRSRSRSRAMAARWTSSGPSAIRAARAVRYQDAKGRSSLNPLAPCIWIASSSTLQSALATWVLAIDE